VAAFYANLEVDLEIVMADVFNTALETTLKTALKITLGMTSNAAILCSAKPTIQHLCQFVFCF
jgi:hypothetical protein